MHQRERELLLNRLDFLILAFRTIRFYERGWIERECPYIYMRNGLLLVYRLVLCCRSVSSMLLCFRLLITYDLPDTLSVEEIYIQGAEKPLYRIAEPPDIVHRRRTPNERLP